MTSVNVTELKNTVTVNEGDATVVTVTTAGPQGTFVDGDLGDVTVSSNGANIVVNAGAIDNANIASNAAIELTKLATGALPTAITVTSANISDLSIVNADINASAAIAGTKISPDFGSQDITTSGHIDLPDASTIKLGDSDEFQIQHTAGGASLISETGSGNLEIRATNINLKDSNANNKLATNSLGVAITGNLDVSNGADITGNITVTGTVDGRDVAADGTKLDTVETNAKDDQTAAEIKTLLNSDGIVNAQIDASAAIAGSKIDPSFTSNIFTTGQQLQFSNNAGGRIKFSDANNNPDYMIRSSQGKLQIDQNDDSTPIFKINTDGHVDINNNLDCGAV